MRLVEKDGLIAPELYWQLSDEQRRDISNGCGPQGWGWLVPDRFRLLGINFAPACDPHDYMYHVGADKKLADNVFLENCMACAERAFFGCKVIARWLAFQYFLKVKNNGAGAYNRANGKEC